MNYQVTSLLFRTSFLSLSSFSQSQNFHFSSIIHFSFIYRSSIVHLSNNRSFIVYLIVHSFVQFFMSQTISIYDENADLKELFLKDDLRAAIENHESQIFSTVDICSYFTIDSALMF